MRMIRWNWMAVPVSSGEDHAELDMCTITIISMCLDLLPLCSIVC